MTEEEIAAWDAAANACMADCPTMDSQDGSATEPGDGVAAAFAAVDSEPFESGTEKEEAPGKERGLPPIITFSMDSVPKRRPELIKGVLHLGENAIISSGSKSNKTWNIMGLAISVATGTPWLGFDCRAGRVLYINGELTEEGCLNRFNDICRARGISPDDIGGKLDVMQARGGGDEEFPYLVSDMLAEIEPGKYELVIIDPIYIFMDGDENSAGDVRDFMRSVAELGNGLGCSIAFVHHHSKGAQGDKSSIDRMSGSGVFGRWCDTVLDFIPLVYGTDEEEAATLGGTAKPFRAELDLRDFHDVAPFDMWFKYPLFIRDYEGKLAELSPDSMSARGGKKRAAQMKKDAADDWTVKELSLVAEITTSPNGMISKAQALEICGWSDDHTLRKWIKGDESKGVPPSKRLKFYNPTRNTSYLVLSNFEELAAGGGAGGSTPNN